MTNKVKVSIDQFGSIFLNERLAQSLRKEIRGTSYGQGMLRVNIHVKPKTVVYGFMPIDRVKGMVEYAKDVAE